MSKDPRGHVKPGDKLRIAAEQINFLNGLMRTDTGFKDQPLVGYEPGRNVILARNNTGDDLPRWGIMAITGIELDPNDGDSERRSFEEMPCVTGTVPGSDSAGSNGSQGRVCVAVEPIKDGAVGRVAVSGVVACRTSSRWDGASTAGMLYAAPQANTVETISPHVDGPMLVLWSGGGWALVRLGFGPVGMRLGKATGVWNKGTTKDVVFHRASGEPINEDITFTAINRFATVGSTGQYWVACGFMPGGTGTATSWHLIAAECSVPSSGGSS